MCEKDGKKQAIFRVAKKSVTPVKTGVQRIPNDIKALDSGFRRNDEKIRFTSSCEISSLKNSAFVFYFVKRPLL